MPTIGNPPLRLSGVSASLVGGLYQSARCFLTPPNSAEPLALALVWTALGFLAGSFPFSVWLGRWIAHADVRRFGDGNPGSINAWRAGGWRAGLPALLLDFLKGAVPVAAANFLCGLTGWWLVPIALAPVPGHAFSPWLGFQGGKAIAATFGVWTGLLPGEGPSALGLFLAIAFTLLQTDAWSMVAGMLAFVVYLGLRHSTAPLLGLWAGNLAILLWRQRLDLQTPPRLRP